MNESRVFMLNGTDVQKIVTRLEGVLSHREGYGGAKFRDYGGLCYAGEPAEGRMENADRNAACRYRADDGYGKSAECKHRRRAVVG